MGLKNVLRSLTENDKLLPNEIAVHENLVRNSFVDLKRTNICTIFISRITGMELKFFPLFRTPEYVQLIWSYISQRFRNAPGKNIIFCRGVRIRREKKRKESMAMLHWESKIADGRVEYEAGVETKGGEKVKEQKIFLSFGGCWNMDLAIERWPRKKQLIGSGSMGKILVAQRSFEMRNACEKINDIPFLKHNFKWYLNYYMLLYFFFSGMFLPELLSIFDLQKGFFLVLQVVYCFQWPIPVKTFY